MTPYLLIGLLILATIGVCWLAWKRVRTNVLVSALVWMVLGFSGFSLLFWNSLRCIDACPTSFSSADVGPIAILIGFTDIFILLIASLSGRAIKNRLADSLRTDAPTSATPLPDVLPQAPDPLNPNNVWTPIVTGFYRLKESQWYLSFLAAFAFIVGYYLFVQIARLQGALIHPDPLVGFQDRDFLLMAFIEQMVLGIIVFAVFAASRTYQLTLFLYAGFLTYHVQLITERMMPNDPLLFLLTPVVIYAFTGFLVTLGLLFTKKLGALFLILTIFLLANYNTRTLLGRNISFRNIFFPAELEQKPSATKVNDKGRETSKTSSAWCQVYTKEQRRSASGTTQNLKEALEFAGYSVFLLDKPRGLPVPSPFISVADFQTAHGLSITGSLTKETYDVIDRQYSCGKASDYGLAFGDSDFSVASISNALNGLSGVAQGRVLRFNTSSKPAIELQFFSRDYKGGAPNDSEYPSPNYSFATNYAVGERAALRRAACDPSTIADSGVLLGKERLTRIACKEIQNGYIGYIAYRHFQAPEISLYALAALYTGSTTFPTAYAQAMLDDATLNDQLLPEEYVRTVTNAFSQSTSQIASRAAAFEVLVNGVHAIP